MRTACVSILFFLILQEKSRSVATNMDPTAVSSAIAKFSLRFCNELDKTKSVVSSPLSAEILLALLTLGTTDPAHEQLLGALGIADDDSIRSSFSILSSKLKSVSGITLNVANKVYLNDGGYELEPKLKQDAVDVFNAGFQAVNFSNGGAAAKLINDWVESKTSNQIKDLLSSDSLNSDTRLVLVNALYFKGTWKHQFRTENTQELPFHVSRESTINIPMMYMEENFKYGESQMLKAQMLEMPYQGEAASMVIILPNELDGLDGMLRSLAEGVDLMEEMKQMFSMKVKVTIPKFKIETEIDLAELLPKLGIDAIFDQKNSGLTKLLTSSEALYVSKAVQKAFIEVNEEGAEAAAATAMAFAPCCAMIDFNPVKVFTADRPFLAVIQVHGAPFFIATQRSA